MLAGAGRFGESVCSARFVVKPEGGQQCIFDVFLTKPVGVNKNLGVERHQRRRVKPPTPDKSSSECVKDDMKLLGFKPEWAIFRNMWRDITHGTNV